MFARKMLGLVMALSFVAMAPAASAEDNCSISGKVNLKGGKDACPKRKKLNTDADPFCAKQKAIGTEDVICNKDGTLRNVVVFIKEGLGDRKFETPAEPVVLDQQGCRYEPHIVVLMPGQTLTVKNSDETLHNIHGLPKKNAEFNFGQPKAGMSKDLDFQVPEEFKVKCDVHPWMGAYILVRENPFFSVTEKDGLFALSNLPPGEYVVAAWHETYGEITQKVKVSDGETQEIVFEFEPK